MAHLPADPLQFYGIAEYGVRLRRGDFTVEAITEKYLARIRRLNPRLRAFTYVGEEQALTTAREIDRLLVQGRDLGPLMGVPIAVKDLFTIDGLPLPKVGSRLDVIDLIQPEGEFVRRLKLAGCVILGKTTMTEFAVGLVNVRQETPWNPWDAKVHRMPGGSSSGSAVALAAGLCAFSVGTDTGGSVRHPAAMCGVFGLKATPNLWATQGVFPLSSTLDSIGFFTSSAADAAAVFGALTNQQLPKPNAPKGLRLGTPTQYFEALSPDVKESIDYALDSLRDAGVELVPIDVPELGEVETLSTIFISTELVAHLGTKRAQEAKEIVDPVIWQRIEAGFGCSAIDYIQAQKRQRELRHAAEERMKGVDGWIAPTTPDTAPPVAQHVEIDKAMPWMRRGTRNTRPANVFAQCASSLPIRAPGKPLPAALQIICRPGHETALLSVSQRIEAALAPIGRPDVSSFS